MDFTNIIYLFHWYLSYIIKLNYNTRSASSDQLIIPSFRTNLRRFCPSVIGRFFWSSIPQLIRDKPSKKCLEKHYHAGTLLSTNETSSLNDLELFYNFSFTCLIKNYSLFLLYVTLRGTILVYLDVSCIIAALAMVLKIRLFLLRKTCEILRHLLPKYLNQRNLVPRASRLPSLFLR